MSHRCFSVSEYSSRLSSCLTRTGGIHRAVRWQKRFFYVLKLDFQKESEETSKQKGSLMLHCHQSAGMD